VKSALIGILELGADGHARGRCGGEIRYRVRGWLDNGGLSVGWEWGSVLDREEEAGGSGGGVWRRNSEVGCLELY
jgi:hypothetical protein